MLGKLVIATAAAALLTGCVTTNEQMGTLIGGALGGAIGNQVGKGTGRTVATVAGTIAGSMIGASIGRSMDKTDRAYLNQALEKNPTGKSLTWHNPDTGIAYSATPMRTYNQGTGVCREYVVLATINGQREEIYGTACRQADGTWRTN